MGQRPVDIDEFDSKLPQLDNTAIRVGHRSFTRNDVPNLTCIDDANEQRNTVVVCVGNMIGYSFCCWLTFEVRNNRPRVEHDSFWFLRHQSFRSLFFSVIKAFSNPLPLNFPRRLWTNSLVIGFRMISPASSSNSI